MSSRPRKKIAAFFNTTFHIVRVKPLKETERTVVFDWLQMGENQPR